MHRREYMVLQKLFLGLHGPPTCAASACAFVPELDELEQAHNHYRLLACADGEWIGAKKVTCSSNELSARKEEFRRTFPPGVSIEVERV